MVLYLIRVSETVMYDMFNLQIEFSSSNSKDSV